MGKDATGVGFKSFIWSKGDKLCKKARLRTQLEKKTDENGKNKMGHRHVR